MAAQQHSDSWWMGYLGAEIGAFLAGLHPVESMRQTYREFYRSPQVQEDEGLRKWLAEPTKRKLNVKG